MSIFHIASASDWAQAVADGEYRTSTRGRTLDDEGFIHASHPHQVRDVANNYYRDAGALVLLEIDTDRLRPEVRDEGGFPHIHGPLNVDAVVSVRDFHVDALTGERVVLRRAQPSDVEPFSAMFSMPGMERWWPGADREKLAREHIDPDDATVFAVLLDDHVVGLIQYWEETDVEYRHAGIDIALDPSVHEQGFGTDAVRTMARYLFDELLHHRVVIDPAADNARAIRCYEKVGFKPVGIMRKYERGHDGTFRDGLLMDMLRGDLTEG